MKNKLGSLVALLAMMLSLGGSSAFANTPSGSNDTAAEKAVASSAKTDRKAEEKLKSNVLKLVAEAKAGKVAPRAPQFPNSTRNNLSTGAKIGIVAGIAGLIFVLIVIHQVNSD